MTHYRSFEDIQLKDAWVTIGSYDGVHLGHQEIIKNLTAGAHSMGAPAVVLTFYPHPALVLGKRKDPYYLTTPETKSELLEDLGVDVIITLPFNIELSQLSAFAFMEMVSRHLGVRMLWVGHDFALGKGREGNVERLKEIGVSLNYQVQVLQPVKLDGEVVSSSAIRVALQAGDVERAARFLGRPHMVPGVVVPGDGRGKTIGVPTANMDVPEEIAVPKTGVYVCRVAIHGQDLGAVTNIGVRPTFETDTVRPRVETHILDYQEDLYGKNIRLKFLSRIRDEQRFPDIQSLIAQIHSDISIGRKVLAEK